MRLCRAQRGNQRAFCEETEKTITDKGDRVYKLTVPAAVKEPHLFISFGNKPTERDTRG